MENANFLKDAITKIEELAKAGQEPHYKELHGETFIVYKDGNYERIEVPEKYVPRTLNMNSLDALVQAVKTEAVPRDTLSPVYLMVGSFDTVDCFLQPDADNRFKRNFLYKANATDVPGFRDCTWSFEQAMIALRARFQPTEDVSYMLNLLSHMSVDQSVQSDDNGVTQTVQVKQGVSFVANEAVRPIVTLAPYRTFQEVDQPASQFVFRVDEKRNVTLAEADGGMWKLEARRTVKQYLADALADEIKAGRVIVTL